MATDRAFDLLNPARQIALRGLDPHIEPSADEAFDLVALQLKSGVAPHLTELAALRQRYGVKPILESAS
jgi:hypothetical protein